MQAAGEHHCGKLFCTTARRCRRAARFKRVRRHCISAKIVLFHPRGRPCSPGKPDVHSLACVMPPIGLASLAAVLRKEGHEIRIVDAALAPRVSNESWAERITAEHPDFVGVTSTTSGFPDAYDVCERVKRRAPDMRIVFGGVHVSWGKERFLRAFPAIDFVVAGEGEGSLAKLVAGDPPDTIGGLSYRDGTAVRSAPAPAPQCRMDDLPFPAYDLLSGFPRRYLPPLFSYPRGPAANIVSSRGCVYQCSYCDRSVFGKSFRWNSPEYTFEQVKWLRRDFGVRHVTFYDDLFTLNRARVAALCDLLAKARLGVTFNCIVRIGHIDRELIGLLKAGNCWMVHVGIESGDQRILDKHKEGVSLEAIRTDIGRLHGAGLWVKGLFMMGFPGESEESIAATRELALSLPLKDANITAFTPFPGAPISESIDTLGQLDNDWAKMDCEHFVFVPNEIGSRRILEKHYRLFIEGFYRRPAMRAVYLKMLLQSPHGYWRLAAGLPHFLAYARGLGGRA